MNEYYKDYYTNNKQQMKKNKEKYWVKKTRIKLNKDDVTEEEVKACKNEYYRQYRKNSSEKSSDVYWTKKAKKILNKDTVTEEEVKACRNEYYRQYRKNNPEKIKQIQKRFLSNWKGCNYENKSINGR